MAFAENLYSRLVADVGVGAIAGDRIYPNVFKQQGTKPAIRYHQITGQAYHQMGVDAGIEKRRYQIDVIAKTYAIADSLRDAVKASLSRWSEAGIVQDSYFVSDSDQFDSDKKMHRIIIDFDFIVEV